ncbi:MAG TPA: EAL domain-containing protein [Longimicrobium sp.]|jgi:diguanylate cyclase (GGDEF)-like protein/PAS domain S-box-containing protein|uniref:putative bifunctional diguanylate cyclase/phosphodiesterase n=1 Tax=Longimicrobium sp. TaxID=2029185 RepID=UPI002ED7E061
MRTTLSTPESSSAAHSGDGEILARLAAAAVTRLQLGASAVLLDAADAPLHSAGAPEFQQVLLRVILHHRAAIRQAPAGSVRVLSRLTFVQQPSYPQATLALVPLALPDGEPLGTLLALHPGDWSAVETFALESLARAAVAELRWRREREARRHSEDKLTLLERALETVDLGVTITDEQGTIVFTNPAEARMHGYQVEELYGREARSLAPPELWNPGAAVPARPVRRWMRERVNVRRDGTRFPVRLWSDVVAADDDRPLGLVTWTEDLSARGEPVQPAADADRDPMTGLPNRAAFLRALGQACDAKREQRGQNFVVLFVDLDRFKAVNDRLGHAAGDAFLAVAAERLAASVRPTDLVARIGGDEFAALLHGVEREADALAVVQRIQRLLGAPVTIGDAEMTASASIGVALCGSADTPEGILAVADRAMYRAKSLGAGHHGFSEPGVRDHEEALLQVEQDLRRAIRNDELTLRFQPIVCLKDGRLEGLEALVRWNHPERGLLGPQAFLPVAEEMGTIVEVDRWVLCAAARQLKAWGDHPVLRSVPVSVNFSGRHVVHPRVVQDVERTLREYGVDPRRLIIEVTETSFVEDFQTAASVLAALRDHGVGICLDDFGTGYSSLGYLRQFGFDRLKIDRSFVQRIGENAADEAIVRSIVALAEALNLTLTAEGVETVAQRTVLQRLGCRDAQGFLFARPMDVPELGAWLLASA